jgi:KTSC domain
MNRTKVDSEQIKSIGFDPVNKILEVEFPRGAVYQYEGEKVESHYTDLMAAHAAGESVGKVFNAKVRNCPHTKYHKLPPEPPVAA